MVFAAQTKIMINTMIVIVKVTYKMIPHVILQFCLMVTIESSMSITGTFDICGKQWK